MEDELANAFIDQEILRAKWEANKTKEKSQLFHDTTRRWMQGRQKLLDLYEQLPSNILEEAVEKKVFPQWESAFRSSFGHEEGKSPLEDLRSLHKKAHDLREILQDRVNKQLNLQ